MYNLLELPAVPRKGVGKADCDTKINNTLSIYPSVHNHMIPFVPFSRHGL